MRTVKSLLLGSAVGLVTVSVGQAADLPVKAKPVEYVKVCSLYGEGFWYIPGTDTCIKLGGFVRYEVSWGAGNNFSPAGLWNGNDNNVALGSREFDNALNQAVAGVISVDVRTPTDYGTLRSYLDLGAQSTSVMTWGGYNSPENITQLPGPGSSGGAGQTVGNIGYAGLNYNNESTFVTRAFIQFAGFTAGRMRSFFDINSMGPYSISANRIQGDTAGQGLLGIGYTAQLGGGVSASVALEDGGTVFGGRGYNIMNLSLNNVSPTGSGAAAVNTISFGPGDITSNAAVFSMDPVVNVRIDQAWGYAQISGALHGDNGAYYGNSQSGASNPSPVVPGLGYPELTTSGWAAGHPDNKWGWATTAGFTLNNVLGLKGDTAGAQVAYCVGAQGYCNRFGSGAVIWNNNKATYVEDKDGTYANLTQISLTQNWTVTAFYEHYWNPKWRTSLFGGVSGVDYSGQEKSQICPVIAGGTGLQWNSGFTFLPGSTCNPNFTEWAIGTRTMWNPHPYLDIGVEVIYNAIQQSNTGSFSFSGASGQSATIATFANQGVWAGLFRIQRNFLY